jgi:hypothetical protein
MKVSDNQIVCCLIGGGWKTGCPPQHPITIGKTPPVNIGRNHSGNDSLAIMASEIFGNLIQ